MGIKNLLMIEANFYACFIDSEYTKIVYIAQFFMLAWLWRKIWISVSVPKAIAVSQSDSHIYSIWIEQTYVAVALHFSRKSHWKQSKSTADKYTAARIHKKEQIVRGPSKELFVILQTLNCEQCAQYIKFRNFFALFELCFSASVHATFVFWRSNLARKSIKRSLVLPMRNGEAAFCYLFSGRKLDIGCEPEHTLEKYVMCALPKV
jgi:hypothetical protein